MRQKPLNRFTVGTARHYLAQLRAQVGEAADSGRGSGTNPRHSCVEAGGPHVPVREASWMRLLLAMVMVAASFSTVASPAAERISLQLRDEGESRDVLELMTSEAALEEWAGPPSRQFALRFDDLLIWNGAGLRAWKDHNTGRISSLELCCVPRGIDKASQESFSGTIWLPTARVSCDGRDEVLIEVGFGRGRHRVLEKWFGELLMTVESTAEPRRFACVTIGDMSVSHKASLDWFLGRESRARTYVDRLHDAIGKGTPLFKVPWEHIDPTEPPSEEHIESLSALAGHSWNDMEVDGKSPPPFCEVIWTIAYVGLHDPDTSAEWLINWVGFERERTGCAFEALAALGRAAQPQLLECALRFHRPWADGCLELLEGEDTWVAPESEGELRNRANAWKRMH